MSVASGLLQIKNKISTALSHCNDALALKGAEQANSIWEVGDRINEISSADDSLLVSIVEGWASEIVLPEGITEVKESLFYHVFSLTSVVLPEGLRGIWDYAFGCTNITSINLPDSVTWINEGAFTRTKLESIKLPPSLQKLSAFVFSYCDYLSYVDIPESITTIEYYAFSNCTNLASVVIRRTSNIISIYDKNVFEGTKISTGIGYIYVPQALLSEYQNATNWSTYANQFRALEEYTVDGTITGELDVSKI